VSRVVCWSGLVVATPSPKSSCCLEVENVWPTTHSIVALYQYAKRGWLPRRIDTRLTAR
jgi:hypothetical protein